MLGDCVGLFQNCFWSLTLKHTLCSKVVFYRFARFLRCFSLKFQPRLTPFAEWFPIVHRFLRRLSTVASPLSSSGSCFLRFPTTFSVIACGCVRHGICHRTLLLTSAPAVRFSIMNPVISYVLGLPFYAQNNLDGQLLSYLCVTSGCPVIYFVIVCRSVGWPNSVGRSWLEQRNLNSFPRVR